MLEIKEYDGAKPKVVMNDKEKNMAKLLNKIGKKSPKKTVPKEKGGKKSKK